MSSNINPNVIFKRICDDSKDHADRKRQDSSSRMLVDSEFGKKKKLELDKFKSFIQENIDFESIEERIKFKTSIGQTTLNFIPWIIFGIPSEGNSV